MKTRRKARVLLLAAMITLFFLSACIAGRMNEGRWRTESTKETGGLIPADASEFDDGPCLCSKCTGGAGNHSFWSLIGLGDPTLRAAQCEFIACDFKSRDEERIIEGGAAAAVFSSDTTGIRRITEGMGSLVETVTVTSVESLLADDTAVKLPFMFGQGGTFAEFAKSQQLCDSQYKLAVKWLEGGEATLGTGATMKYAPPQPYKKQAECLLDANIIPVYIWYTRGTSLDYNKHLNHEYAAKLNGVGPVIVTPEAMYDSTNAGVVNKVKNQLAGIQDDCPNCLVMLVPREATGDAYTNSIKAVIDEVKLGTPPSDKVDLIGKIVVLDETYDCEFGNALEAAASDAKATMRKFRKPTMLLFYMPYDGVTCTKAPLPGETVGETVSFDVGKAAETYEFLAENSQSLLLPKGIIAVVPMQLQDRKPVPDAIGNSYGFIKLIYSEESLGAKNPALKAWFDECSVYYRQDDTATPEINGYWQSMMITSYQGKTGPYCEAHNNIAIQAANKGDQTDPYNFDRYQEKTTPYLKRGVVASTAPIVTREAVKECVSKEEFAPRTGLINRDWGMMALRSKYALTTIIPWGGYYVSTLNFNLAVKTASEKCDIDESLLRALLSKSGELTFTDASVLDPGNANYRVGVICAYWQKELDSITKVEGGGGAGVKVVTNEPLLRQIKQKAAFFTALDYAMNELSQTGDGTLVNSETFRGDPKFYEKVCMPPAPPPPADGSTPPATTVPVGHGIYYPCLVIDTYNQDYTNTDAT